MGKLRAPAEQRLLLAAPSDQSSVVPACNWSWWPPPADYELQEIQVLLSVKEEFTNIRPAAHAADDWQPPQDLIVYFLVLLGYFLC